MYQFNVAWVLTCLFIARNHNFDERREAGSYVGVVRYAINPPVRTLQDVIIWISNLDEPTTQSP